MHKQELAELNNRLAQLADALGGRAPSAAGLLVWGDALRECRFDDVQAALTDWPKKNTKTPSPADILKACRERTSARIEEKARRNAAGSGFEPEQLLARSEVAKAALRQINEILATPRPGPKDWARVLKIKEESGEPLDVQQRRLWREALKEGV